MNKNNIEIARAVFGVASELAEHLFDLISKDEDWEPIVNMLPSTKGIKAKHDLAEAIARKKLEDARKAAFGEE